MPVVRVPTGFGDLELAVKEIERKARIIAAVPQGDGSVILFTEAKRTPARETR